MPSSIPPDLTSRRYKVHLGQGNHQTPHAFPDLYAVQPTTGPKRLIIGPSGQGVDVLLKLASVLPEPFRILYVSLLVRPSRYRSEIVVSRGDMETFARRYQPYFEGDSFHHLWITSVPQNDLLVYDRHDVIFAYGPLYEYKFQLCLTGFKRKPVRIPYPHTHFNHSDFDRTRAEILGTWRWTTFPLAPTDDD